MRQAQLDLFDPSVIHWGAGPRRRRNEMLEVARLALLVSRRQLRDYSRPKSKHVFTQPQLMACLVIKAYAKLTYRGMVDLLDASEPLRKDVLGMGRVPAHTTLKEFFDRVVVATPGLIDALVGEVLALLQERGLVVGELAVDSTGMQTTCASAHFVSRARRRCGGYVKLSMAVACASIVLVSVAMSMGPTNDLCEAATVLWPTAARCAPDWVFQDSGYDAERVHRFWKAAGATSHIPPVPRTADGSVKSGPGRVRCRRHRPYHYGRRWHAESFISGMKRTCGSTLSARSERCLLAEAGLKALAYAIRR